MVILIPVLIVSVSCTSTEKIIEDSTYRDVLISMIPSLPEVPSLPKLEWIYKDGLYSLDEHNVDLLLDYGENILPHFRWELEQYRKKLDAVISGLR